MKKKDCNKLFLSACKNGHSKITDSLMRRSAELKIDLNFKDIFERTAFHLACINGHSKLAEMLMQKSALLNIDLNVKDNAGKTAFSLACELSPDAPFRL